MDETVTDYDAIQKRWHETQPEWEVGEWVSLTDPLGHVIEVKRVAKQRQGPEQEAMYQRHQLADKSIHIITLLHDDGTKSSLRLTPHHDGFSLAITLGTGKVLHDLTFHREDDASD